MKNLYRQLSKAYGLPESKYLPKILEKCLTKQEALVLLTLAGTPEVVAEALGMKVPMKTMSRSVTMAHTLFSSSTTVGHQPYAFSYALLRR